jgi:hypothetical protein
MWGMPSRAGAHQSVAVRPRYSRIGAAGTSLAVTMVAVLGATGVIPTGEVEQPALAAAPQRAVAAAPQRAVVAAPQRAVVAGPVVANPVMADPVAGVSGAMRVTGAARPLNMRMPEGSAAREPLALPEDSGDGRRVVFDQSQQRVWLVGETGRGKDDVKRTYLVSGSLTDNLDPGTYEVWSRSRNAIGVDNSGTMKYMVRFAYGEQAAIGFHDIPVDEGQPVQTLAELGTPQSHGCIRQDRDDAIALWEFAPVGTTVVVTA